MLPGWKRCGPISATGVTSAPVPQMTHSLKVGSSSGMIRRSTVSMPRSRARSITVRRVMPSQEAIGDRRVQLPVAREEHVRAGAFGDPSLPVEHERVRVAFALGRVLGKRRDHVEAGRLGGARGRPGIGAAPFGHVEPDTLHLRRHVEHRGPGPDADRDVDGGVLGRDRHHLRPTPGDRPNIDVRIAVLLHAERLRGVELGHRIRDLEIMSSAECRTARNARST